MKKIKRRIVRIAFVAEIMLVSFYYFFGSHGLQALRALSSSNKELLSAIEILEQETNALKHELAEWKTDTFYKEKQAREKLQLAYANEDIYFLPS
ncbi:septum formation initiator family protein [Candidatus Dependentiae bacterium]|nr:septum formation initiator family protein [Candidatus Dependentiae bacterium]